MAIFSTLTSYLADVRRLLHDANALYWSDTDLTSFINRAMQQRDRDMQINRKLVTAVSLPQGQSTYSITTVDANAFDVLGIIVIWGNYRYLLEEVPYTDLSVLYNVYQGYQNIPVGFAKYGPTAIQIAPTPSSTFTSEWDLLVYSTPLAVGTDQDPIPYPWTDPVPFLAAHFAKLEIANVEDAAKFLQMYGTRVNEVMGGARGRSLPRPYGYRPSMYG